MRILEEINGCYLWSNRDIANLDHKSFIATSISIYNQSNTKNDIHKNGKLSNLKRESRHILLEKTKFKY